MLNVKRIKTEKLTVVSDLKEKPFRYRYEVPEKVLRENFSWLTEDDSDSFFNYRGVWYHLSQFMRVENHAEFSKAGWQGYHGDSFFSGILLTVSKWGETYVVGTYFS